MGAVRRPTLAMLLVVLATAGCGRDRLAVPDPDRPFTAGRLTTVAYPAAGIRFRGPADWRFDAGEAPLVATTSSGNATIAIWRYPRTEPIPTGTGPALETARKNLLNAAKGRDASFKEVSSRRQRVDGEPAIEVVGSQTVAGNPRRVRSTHVFAHGAELVVDAYAAPDVFPVVDRTVFRPLLRSLKLEAPKG